MNSWLLRVLLHKSNLIFTPLSYFSLVKITVVLCSGSLVAGYVNAIGDREKDGSKYVIRIVSPIYTHFHPFLKVSDGASQAICLRP